MFRNAQNLTFSTLSLSLFIWFFLVVFFSFIVGVKVGDTLYNLKVHLMHKFPKEMWAFPANYFVTFTKTICCIIYAYLYTRNNINYLTYYHHHIINKQKPSRHAHITSHRITILNTIRKGFPFVYLFTYVGVRRFPFLLKSIFRTVFGHC